MKARIYPQSRNVMQSGLGKVGVWILEYEQETARAPEAVMGWTSSGDSLGQVRMKFPDQESAEAFARSKNIDYTVSKQHTRIVTPRNYVDNFKYRPIADDQK